MTHATRTPFGCTRRRRHLPTSVQVRPAAVREMRKRSPGLPAGTGEKSRTENEQCELLRSGRRPSYWRYCKASRGSGTCFCSKWPGSSCWGAPGPCRGPWRDLVRPSAHEQRGRRAASEGGFRQVRDSQREAPKGQVSPLPTCTGGASELIDRRVRPVQCKAETPRLDQERSLSDPTFAILEVPCGGVDPGDKPDAPRLLDAAAAAWITRGNRDPR